MPIDPPSAPGGRRPPPRTPSGELEMWRRRALAAEQSQRDLEQIAEQNEERRRLEHEDFLRSIDRRIRDCVDAEFDRRARPSLVVHTPQAFVPQPLTVPTSPAFAPMAPPGALGAPLARPPLPSEPTVFGGGHAPPGVALAPGAMAPGLGPMRLPAASMTGDVVAYAREVRAERFSRLLMAAIPVSGGLATLIVSAVLSHCDHSPAVSTTPVPSPPAHVVPPLVTPHGAP